MQKETLEMRLEKELLKVNSFSDFTSRRAVMLRTILLLSMVTLCIQGTRICNKLRR